MDIEKKLKNIEKLLKRKKNLPFVRVEVTWGPGADKRYNETHMYYLVPDSFNKFPEQIIFSDYVGFVAGAGPFPLNSPIEEYVHNIEKITLLKTR